jgi:O-acetyl-ADP-ribose deacetylase (regulator of RNase III)
MGSSRRHFDLLPHTLIGRINHWLLCRGDDDYDLELCTSFRMITYCSGDIFADDAECLVNPVNCVGVMGKGLALEFKRRFPSMYTVYRKLCLADDFKVGQIVFYTDMDSGKRICLFPTKSHWRDKSTVDLIELGFQRFIEYAPQAKVTRVAFPKVGCGLGGLDFDLQVRPLFEKYFRSSNFDVRVYI